MPGHPWIRDVYVISDLHLGGEYADASSDGRGFRLFTRRDTLVAFLRWLTAKRPPVELVINGDFVDFLAEAQAPVSAIEGTDAGKYWLPFVVEPAQACATFRRLAQRDLPVFEALGELVRAGHALTLLLGNHDLELSLPEVRRELEALLGIRPDQYRFIYDGEAYAIGDALIEHGNRYDPVNVVDHDALRRLRSLQSRSSHPKLQSFAPPAGSRLVSSVINRIKDDFPFVDLLKPESEPLVAVLLALAPELKWQIGAVLSELSSSLGHGVVDDLPFYGGNVSSRSAAPATESSPRSGTVTAGSYRSLADFLAPALGSATAEYLGTVDDLLEAQPSSDSEPWFGGEVANRPWRSRLTLLRLALQRSGTNWKRRVFLVRRAFRCFDPELGLDDESVETARRYRAAAEALSRGAGRPRWRWVLFGHTHHAKVVQLESGATYVNTGTWCDQMRFPRELYDDDESVACAALETFLADLESGNLAPHLRFRPTYARLRMAPDQTCTAELLDFDPPAPRERARESP